MSSYFAWSTPDFTRIVSNKHIQNFIKKSVRCTLLYGSSPSLHGPATEGPAPQSEYLAYGKTYHDVADIDDSHKQPLANQDSKILQTHLLLLK